ncbi:hypothetical protein HDU78_011262 [Chytriomyces hyalinus]|nr:hypothetical protein HDU78_011262 [Chytriomyces hyalinus]
MNMIAHLQKSLHAKGLDIAAPFLAQTYNSACGKLPPLATFGRSRTLAVLVGNSRHLWPHFERHCAANPALVAASADPLDDYVTQSVEDSVREVSGGVGLNDESSASLSDAASLGVPSSVFADGTQPPTSVAMDGTLLAAKKHTKSDIRYTCSKDDKFVHFQRLAHDVGVAFFNRTVFLCVHPTFGPWFAFRAVIVFDMDFDSDWVADLQLYNSPIPDPYPECSTQVQEWMDKFYAAAKEYSNRQHENHKYLIGARDAATRPEQLQYRYGPEQLRYHYTKDKSVLGVVVAGGEGV